jgi:hypothetical protein
MTAYVSRDGHWAITAIKRDGLQLIRVEHDTVRLPDGSFVPRHTSHEHGRSGITRTAHGFLVADVASVAAVAAYVPLSELEAVT